MRLSWRALVCSLLHWLFLLSRKGRVVRGIGFLIPFLVLLFEDQVLDAIMPYAYAKNPISFLYAFLKTFGPEGAKASRSDLYMMRLLWHSKMCPMH